MMVECERCPVEVYDCNTLRKLRGRGSNKPGAVTEEYCWKAGGKVVMGPNGHARAVEMSFLGYLLRKVTGV